MKASLDQNQNLEKINALNIMKCGTLKKVILSRKIKEKIEKTYDATNITNEKKISDEAEDIMVESQESHTFGLDEI